MFKIMFVCLGNICRSPMAEFLMKDYVAKQGKSEEFYIKSAATGTWELTNPVHPGTKRVLDRLKISCKGKISELLRADDYDKYDYIVGMDSANLRDMKRLFNGDPEGKLSLLLDYTPVKGNVADPYYTGDFEDTYQDVSRGVEGLYNFLVKNK